jgi:hypothetical protein
MQINNKQEARNNSISFFSIFLVGILIYYNNETFPSIYFNGPIDTIFYSFLIITGFFFFDVLVKNEKINSKSTFLMIVLLNLIFITMLLNQDFSGGFIKIIMGIIIGYMLSHLISIEEFAASYVRVMLILAVYSLVVTYIIRPLTFSLPSTIAPIIVNMAGISFIDMKFAVVLNDINYFRNFGIFREPGVYQIFLNFALIFELFFKKTKVNVISVMVFCIAIISTFSTPGYIAALLIIFSFFLIGNNSSFDMDIKKNKKIIAIFVLIILFFGSVLFLYNNIFSNMLVGTVDKLLYKESSYQGRMVAIFANLLVWIESPFFGHGIIELIGQTLEYMQNNYVFSTSHNTSTIGAMLVVFGLIFTAIFIFCLYKLLNKPKFGNLICAISFIAIMISINSQLLIYNELLYTIVAFGMFSEKIDKN